MTKLTLSLDTATPVQSLAILNDSEVWFEAFAKTNTKEGPGLLSLVDDALKHCGLKISDIDRFVVSRGPGAFTGLRVSMAMLKSLALTLDRPLYAGSSLDALAIDAMPSATVVAACIDARRGEIYAAFYGMSDGVPVAQSEELLMKPEDLAAYVARVYPGQKILCTGTAFPGYSKKLAGLTDQLLCRPASPKASVLAKRVVEKYGERVPDVALEALEPKYIRLEDFELPKPFDFSQPGQFRHDA
ncbi:MAG: tRNA (adenosine(37)-N6)-threonylcarbamoyltransferase complex dimerization subunit type 1 TsaB [Proteobacteria bacterium]|nr:tRNA (adenosine(37)-N6)-threonylcarbamoyltransferase complex dimerization subunit type 1 TsaB [Pseudomonadota bacterium]